MNYTGFTPALSKNTGTLSIVVNLGNIYSHASSDLHHSHSDGILTLMIEDTIAKIERRLRDSGSLPVEKRLELEQLLAQLRREAADCPVSDSPGTDRGDDDARSAIDRLQSSVTGFEATHPQLVGLVNRISTVLANMGI